MGKKKDKLLKKQQQEQGQQQQPVPWGSIDADPMAFLCAPEVRVLRAGRALDKQPCPALP
jgi:hypothetical protein